MAVGNKVRAGVATTAPGVRGARLSRGAPSKLILRAAAAAAAGVAPFLRAARTAWLFASNCTQASSGVAGESTVRDGAMRLGMAPGVRGAAADEDEEDAAAEVAASPTLRDSSRRRVASDKASFAKSGVGGDSSNVERVG